MRDFGQTIDRVLSLAVYPGKILAQHPLPEGFLPSIAQPRAMSFVYPSEDGFWVAECPSLPGCISQGETRDLAVANIREAIEGYILALQEDHLPVPEERFDALLVAV